MSKASRDKGARGERELLHALADWLGEDYPPLQRNLQQTRNGGADCIELDGFGIEVKRCERFQSRWFDQAREQAEDAIPVVCWRRNRGQWRVFVELSLPEFADLVRDKG